MSVAVEQDHARLTAPGLCIAVGGTNARTAVCMEGEIIDFESVPTPTEPDDFFGWMARRILDAANAGNAWAVAGYPGPVTHDGLGVGPFANIKGLSQGQFNVLSNLTKADPEVGRLVEQGFTLLNVNDGTLSAHAAAKITGQAYDSVGALIIGTGIGAGVVHRDAHITNTYRTDTRNPNEIGHLIARVVAAPTDTYENLYSGPALERRYGIKPEGMRAGDPAWIEFSWAIGNLATTLGLMNGVEVVVPCGGVGAGARHKYEGHLENWLVNYNRDGNATQQAKAPEVHFIRPEDRSVFEMRGAEGAMLDYMTNPA